MAAALAGTGDGGTARVRRALTPGMTSSAMPTPPNPNRTSRTCSTTIRMRSVRRVPVSGTVTVVASTGRPTGLFAPAHTLTRRGTESAPRSKVIVTCLTTRGDSSRTSNHCPVAMVPGADRQEVVRSPSIAAYG
jgi:hypothetical protein